MKNAAIGIDFGTTNSSVARVRSSGEVELARFPVHLADMVDGSTDAYRSLLYLERVAGRGKNILKSWTGPEGIEQYLAAENKGRLIQSLKSFLSSRGFVDTDVFGKRHTLEELIARILRDLREKSERLFGIEIRGAVIGRPVTFVGAESDADNRYAEGRLASALRMAGFESVEFELEPVAAARYYASTLDHDELIVIGDFGGGTSDFSLVRVGPGAANVASKSVRRGGAGSAAVLHNSGVGVAGDAFDAKIVRHLVSPALGLGSEIRSMQRLLPVPSWVYAKLERWHHLSFLKAHDVMNMLSGIRSEAVEPEKIAAFIHLVKEDLGYQLHRAVQQVKCDLSAQDSATFRFSDGVADITETVSRVAFEEWIGEELAQIEACVDSLFTSSGVRAGDVNMVFLTGGTSFVPAVRRIFEARFGKERIRAGHEFTSVAEGLALKAGALVSL